MTSLHILGLFVLAGLLVQTGILCLAARICRLPRWGVGRAFAIVVVQFVLGVGLAASFLAVEHDPEGSSLVLLVSALHALGTILLMRWLFGGPFGPTIGAWVLQTLLGGVATMALLLGLREFVQADQPTNNAMSPNLRGFHVLEQLPDGNHLIVAANVPNDVNAVPPGTRSGAIVAETFEYREDTRPAGHSHTADRVLCDRTRPPDRWDAVVYRSPQQPTNIILMRVVGLPGERFEIRTGAAWVNGDRLTPPDRLGPIKYSRGVFTPNKFLPGGTEVELGPDEFFVLGDNTQRAADSRYEGPIPRANIIGVVDVIYWPPGRWRRDP